MGEIKTGKELYHISQVGGNLQPFTIPPKNNNELRKGVVALSKKPFLPVIRCCLFYPLVYRQLKERSSTKL
jgi:hypothetical protein